jgi:hypothetical protein
VITSIIEALRCRVPSAFEVKQEHLLPNPMERHLHFEIVPFKKETYSKHESLYPADLIPVQIRDVPPLTYDAKVDEEIKNHGIDALVWYKPFHFKDQKWGIYIRWRGVLHIAHVTSRMCYTDVELVAVRLIKNAFKALHAHAYFHFLTEWAALIMEFLFGRPFYGPYVESFSRGKRLDIEEHLSNAYAVRQVDPELKEAFTKFYRETSGNVFEKYLDDEAFALGKRKLGSNIQASSKEKDIDSCLEVPWEGIFNAEPRQTCIWETPIYWIVEPVPTTAFSQAVQFLLSGYSDRIDSLRRRLIQAFKAKDNGTQQNTMR